METGLTFGFMLLFVLTDLLIVALAIPMIMRRVKPNWLYGFRTPKTMSDERIWYDANAYAGRLLVRMGLACLAAAILLYLVPSVQADMVVYNLTYTGVFFACLFVVVFLSLRYLRSL